MPASLRKKSRPQSLRPSRLSAQNAFPNKREWVILDTNILVSALIVPGGPPDSLYQAWRTGRFSLVSSEEQLEEFRRVTRYPRLQKYIRSVVAGTMLNEIRRLAELTGPLPSVSICDDPA